MLWAAFGALVLLSTVDYSTTNRFLRTADQVGHAHEVLERLDRLLADVTDAETGQRGYLITGAPRYMEPYDRATSHVMDALEALRLVTADDRRQRIRMIHLVHLVKARLAILKRTLDLRTKAGFEAARRHVLTDRGKNVMDVTRRRVGEMVSWERGILVQRSAEARSMGARTIRIVLLGDLGTLAFAGIALGVALRGLSDRKRHTADAEMARERAERQAEELGTLAAALDEARRAAQGASQVKSRFVATVSHEIRTPMTAVLGYIELLSDPLTPEEKRSGYVEIIRRNADHILAVLNDLLDLSRIEAGKLVIERVACSPFELVDEVTSLMRRRAEDKGLAFEVSCRPPLPRRIVTDPFRVRQILINLTSNAIKFTERGVVRLDVSLENEVAGGRLLFAVTDTGPGIDPQHRATLFSAFTSAGGVEARRLGGAGLGLAISKELAKLLDGDLVLEPRGRGSRFVLQIDPGPLEALSMVDRSPPGRDVAIGPAASVRLSGRVLLAEDSPDSRELLALHLRAAGADVTVASDGEEACELAATAAAAGTPFDLVLMDMQMPRLDGYGATGRLRAEGHRGAIVALSAHVMASDRERCIAAGCDAFATKPISRGVLLATARAYLPAREPAGDADSMVSDLASDAEVVRALAAFVRRLPERIATIQEALAGRDLERVADLAHQLKGAATSYGFPSITDAAAALEAAAQQGRDVEAQLSGLARLCRRARAHPGVPEPEPGRAPRPPVTAGSEPPSPTSRSASRPA